jgi:hypothetical protein
VESDVVWAGTPGGVVRWDRSDGNYIKLTAADGLTYNDVRAIAIDAARHKQFGTDGGGVSAFDGAAHEWFATDNGVSEFDGSAGVGTWTSYSVSDGLMDSQVNAIAIDGADHRWFGTDAEVSEFFDEYAIHLTLVVGNYS